MTRSTEARAKRGGIWGGRPQWPLRGRDSAPTRPIHLKQASESGLKLGINGLGRIGKLTLWTHVANKYFDEVLVNVGREVGSSLTDLAAYIGSDSTYGSLARYLHGYRGEQAIRDVNERTGTMTIDGVRVRILRESRNPLDLGWREQGVRLVVDTTGQFKDPAAPPDAPKGSVRGHLEAGAEKVIVSAPFKIKDPSLAMPGDAVTTVMGINENDYDPRVHKIVSNASCTTTCLAHMMKPLIDFFGSRRILTASMATVHAATGSQEVLDRWPVEGTEIRTRASQSPAPRSGRTGSQSNRGVRVRAEARERRAWPHSRGFRPISSITVSRCLHSPRELRAKSGQSQLPSSGSAVSSQVR